jgi:CTP synthase
MPKFIFVTGGVVSGLGKGITTASVGLLLKSAGFEVDAVKFDPYLNIDPGTMSPYEHGEVYVLEDGSETDLDLGHYERFLAVNLNKNSSVSSGKIYDTILSDEREGKYLGKNVQLIPNVTNFIKEKFASGLENKDDNFIRLIEIGGSTGDMEAEIFLESFRQFKQENENVLHIHLGFVPFLKCSNEYKTKPLQNSNRELLRIGLQPDIIAARYYPEKGKKLSQEILDKIALFSNLPQKSVIPLPDLESIYQVPVYLKDSDMLGNLETFVGKELDINLPGFYEKIHDFKNIEKQVKIGIIAKYPKLIDAYLSLVESLKIAGVANDIRVKPIFIDAEKLNPKSKKYSPEEVESLKELNGIIVPGGFGSRGMEGKVEAVKVARENKIPFLGICLGMQLAVVEFARNVCGINAYSTEMKEGDKDIPEDAKYLIDLIPGQKEIHKKGGTMRLGGYKCNLVDGTLAKEIYGEGEVVERHRHRLEVQDEFVPELIKNGLKISGKYFYKNANNEDKYLVELIELDKKDHPYFIATQSHPEFLGRPNQPHPLFDNLVKAAKRK